MNLKKVSDGLHKQYNVKIEITTYKDGTKDYDVMKIISEIKE